MPHVAGHKEGDPILDFTGAFEEEPILDFTGAFGVGQGRTRQRFVPENNSIVNMPATATASFAYRESKELIEGQEGFFGNTSIGELLGAPGGIFDIEDIKKLPGGILETVVQTITGGLRERVVLGAEREFPTPTNIETALDDIEPLVIEAAVDLSKGDFRSGISNLADAFGRLKQVAPFTSPIGLVNYPFSLVQDLAIQRNPELAQRFSDKMLELQSANEDFLIRNGLMFGPDDEPTIVGNLLSQIGLTLSAISGAILLKSPVVPALVFGASQQVSGFQEAEEAGKDPFTAAAIGNVQGVIEGGLTFLELGQLTKIITSKSVSIAGKIGAGMIAEGIEEGTTEALIIGVQNSTGVTDITFDEAANTVFQAVFYGSIAGGGVTGSIATVQRIVGDNVSQEDVEKIARVMADTAIDEAVEITEQAIDDANTELEIGRDNASGQPVTKSAKATAKQQQRVVEILTTVNEGKELDIQQILDETFPEARVQREKQRLEESRRVGARAVRKQGIKKEVVRLQAEIQIAEQQGNEEEAARLSERINQIQQAARTQAPFTDTGIFDIVEELEAEGIFVRGDEQLERAVAEVDNILRPLRAGVLVGRALQKEESKALQDSLSAIIGRLAKKPKGKGKKAIITPDTHARLEKKVRAATTIKSAERIRRDILSLARKAAFRKFISERRESIDKLIADNTKKKVAELDADSQNSLDSINKMRLGMISAVEVKGLPPVEQRSAEEKEQAKITRKEQVDAFNIEQSRRIESDMGQGIPVEGVILQTRYLDILNKKARVTPQAIAAFEDDLNAFITTGKGIATAAEAENQKIMDDTKAQMRSNKVKDLRADIVSGPTVPWDEEFGWWTKTHETQIRALQLRDTPFDLFEPELAERAERNERRRERAALLDEVSEGDGKKYKKELEDTNDMVIDIPLEGHAKQFDGTKPTRIRMTRGRLINAWMLTREESILKQVRDPNGEMAWTDKFVAMIEERMTKQDVEFAEGLFEIYRRSYERFNEEYRRIHNRDLTRVEFYSHISREGQEGLDASTHNETMFIDMIVTKDNDGTGIFPQEPSEAKKRVKNASSEIRIGNVIDMHDKYNWDVEHFISHAQPLILMDKLMKDKEFKADLESILTPGGFVNFKAHIAVAARKNVSSARVGALWKLFENLRQKAFKSTLGLNEKIGLGQTATVMAWAPHMPKIDFFLGVLDYTLHPKKANTILNEHATFRDRELNFDSEIEQLDAVGTVFKFFTISIRKGDGYGVRAGAWAFVLRKTTKEGMSQKDALDEAARIAEISQQSTLPSQKTLAQKSRDPLVRTMTMYRSSLTAMFNVSMQSIAEYRQADISTPAKKKAARKKLYETLVTQNIIIPGLYATLTGRPLTKTVLVGSGSAIPLFSEMFEVIIGVVMNIFAEEDERIYFGGPLTVPAENAFREVNEILDKAGGAVEDTVWNGLEEAMGEATIATFLESTQGIIDVTTGFPMTNAMDKYEAVMKLFETDDPIDASLQMFGYKEDARKLTIERLDLLTGGESNADSDRVLTQGAF